MDTTKREKTMTTLLEKHQVVQMNPETVKNKAFAGCLAVVDEVKAFGAQVYIQVIGQFRDEVGSLAYYRAEWEEMSPLVDDKVPFVLG